MLHVVALLALVLAGARITRLVTTDDLTAPIRQWAVRRFGETSKLVTLIHCPWCAGYWVSLAITALITVSLDWPYPVLAIGLLPFAASYLIGLLDKLDG